MYIDKFLTVPETCSLLSISDRTLRKLSARTDGPKATRIGGSIRYSEAELQNWLEAQEEEDAHNRRKTTAEKLGDVLSLTPDLDGEHRVGTRTHGELRLDVVFDGQIRIVFEGEDGTRIQFECWGVKSDNGILWSHGDVVFSQNEG